MWLPRVKSAAQVVGTYASSQCFAKVTAIFWSYDNKDYSICDRVSAFHGKRQHILSWAVVSVLQLQRSKEQFNRSGQGNIPPAQ